MINIRKAETIDLERVMSLEKALISPPWSLKTVAGEITAENTYFAVAELERKIVGFAIFRINGAEGELFQIAVDENAQKKGIGSALLGAVIEKALETGVPEIFLEVRCSNSAAVALYGKYGFQRAGVRKNYYDKPVEDAYIMVKKINLRSGG